MGVPVNRSLSRLPAGPSHVLTVQEYVSDFFQTFHEIDGVIWKLERAQSFDEGADPSWNAMVRGEWNRSLALLDDARERIAADLPARGELRRLRVVEWPLTPYMQWEFHLLALRGLLGERGRVVEASEVAALETGGPLPELVIFPGARMYQVLYDSRGALAGARWIADGQVIESWTSIVASLYDRAENLADYVARLVVPLPPPRLDHALP